MLSKMIHIAVILGFLAATTLATSSYYNYLDEMANSACVGMSVGHNKLGHITAVRRPCSNYYGDCNAVCRNAPINNPGTGTQAHQWSCFDSLHVYKDHPKLTDNSGAYTDSGKVGPVIYRYGGCAGDCGPNYCCCVA